MLKKESKIFSKPSFYQKEHADSFVNLLGIYANKLYNSSIPKDDIKQLSSILKNKLKGGAKCFAEKNPLATKYLCFENLLKYYNIRINSTKGKTILSWFQSGILDDIFYPVDKTKNTYNKIDLNQHLLEKGSKYLKLLCKDNNLWRLFIGKGLQESEPLNYYENRQKNACTSMAKAFGFALKKINTDINLEILLQIHKLCTKKIIGLNESKKQFSYLPFRTNNTKIQFGLSSHEHKGANLTPSGYKEMCKNINSGKDYWVENNYVITTIFGDKLKDRLIFLLKSYNNEMSKLTDPIKKLKLIIKLTSLLERIHPFFDANCRTICVILFKRELIKHGFKPSIISDPNRFDGFSTDEMLSEVIQGFNNTDYLIKNGKFNKENNFSSQDKKLSEDLYYKTNNAFISAFISAFRKNLPQRNKVKYEII